MTITKWRKSFFLGRLNLILEGFVLLGEQLFITRIELPLQEPLHIFQLGLRILYFGIDTLQRGLELCGIVTDLYGDS